MNEDGSAKSGTASASAIGIRVRSPIAPAGTETAAACASGCRTAAACSESSFSPDSSKTTSAATAEYSSRSSGEIRTTAASGCAYPRSSRETGLGCISASAPASKQKIGSNTVASISRYSASARPSGRKAIFTAPGAPSAITVGLGASNKGASWACVSAVTAGHYGVDTGTATAATKKNAIAAIYGSV